MQGISFLVFCLGWAEEDKARCLFGANRATLQEPAPRAEWWKIPAIAVLIHHPTAGYLLYDTGYYPIKGPDALPEELKEEKRFFWDRDAFLDRQLERVGLSVYDIDGIILSHGHFGHASGVGFFSGTKAGQNVYIAQEELKTALLNAYQRPNGYGNGYLLADYEFPDINYRFVEEGEFVPGIELISLPGHTEGKLLGLILHCEEKTYVFPSDALPTADNYGPPAVAPGSIMDIRGFSQTVEKISAIERRYGATVIFPRDAEQLATLKQARWYR